MGRLKIIYSETDGNNRSRFTLHQCTFPEGEKIEKMLKHVREYEEKGALHREKGLKEAKGQERVKEGLYRRERMGREGSGDCEE